MNQCSIVLWAWADEAISLNESVPRTANIRAAPNKINAEETPERMRYFSAASRPNRPLDG